MTALGMIEVRGYLGAVSVADTAMKAANVTLNNAEIIKGGLTTVEITGDVAAVRAAVAAAVQIAEHLNCLISSHVIARLDEQTEELMNSAELKPSLAVIVTAPEGEKQTTQENASTINSEVTGAESPTTEPDECESLKKKLISKKVVELRTLAYKMNLESLTKKEIKFATKNKLVIAILAEMKGSEIDWN